MADIVDGVVGGAKQAVNDYLKNQSDAFKTWQKGIYHDASTCKPYIKEELEAEKSWLQKAFEKIGLWSDEDTYRYGTPMKCEPTTASQLPPNIYDNAQVSISPSEQAGATVIASSVIAQKAIKVIDTSPAKIAKNIGEELKSEISSTLGNVQIIGKQFSACGDREKYGQSKKKKKANNGKKGKDKLNFHRDHIPADSVMQARAKDIARQNRKNFCPKAEAAIRNGATTTMLPNFIHIDGRTYGGKVKRRFEWDKNNLGAAAKDDIQAVKDATHRALKKKKISKKCAEQIEVATRQMAKKSKAYTDMINEALDLCD